MKYFWLSFEAISYSMFDFTSGKLADENNIATDDCQEWLIVCLEREETRQHNLS